MKNVSYWIDSLDRWPTWPQPEWPSACDVAVIGAGLTGLSAALHLARAGANVHIFDQGPVGGGASMRNGGMTLAGLKHSPGALIEHYGREQALRLYNASLAAIDFIESFTRAEAIDCEFERSGVVWAACTPGHYQGFAAAQRTLQEVYGHRTWLVERARLAEELGSPAYHGGLVDPLSAGLHPGKLVRGLLERALAAGVRVHEHTALTGLTRAAGQFQLATTRGALSAGQVVVGSNGYTPACLPNLQRRVIPIGSYILVTEALPDDVARALIPRGRMVFDSQKFLHYFRMVAGNRLLFGGRASFSPVDDQTAGEKLRQSMLSIFPQLRPYPVEYVWSGKVAFTFTELPHLGQLDGVYYALGYCGHGVAMGAYAGRALAEMVQGQPAGLPFGDLPFEAPFYYRGQPWFLPLAGWYFGWLDRLAR